MTKAAFAAVALCLVIAIPADARKRHYARAPAVNKDIAAARSDVAKLRTEFAALKKELASVKLWGRAPIVMASAAPMVSEPVYPSSLIAASFAMLHVPDVREFPADPPRKANPNDIDDYLFSVYERTATKVDSAGDFTWKDPAAAKRVGKTLQEYVIGGMNRDFRESLYHAGKAMDAAGIKWTILSAFRDDYRQKIAAGFKASGGNSRHGGDRATKGYGDGQAIDIAGDGVFRWMDRNGRRYGLYRPMPGADPNHVQAGGDWHRIAQNLRGGIQLASADGKFEIPRASESRVAERTRVRKVRHHRQKHRRHHRHS